MSARQPFAYPTVAKPHVINFGTPRSRARAYLERLKSLRGSPDFWPVFEKACREVRSELRLHVSANGWGHYPGGKGWMKHAEGREVMGEWLEKKRFEACCEAFNA